VYVGALCRGSNLYSSQISPAVIAGSNLGPHAGGDTRAYSANMLHCARAPYHHDKKNQLARYTVNALACLRLSTSCQFSFSGLKHFIYIFRNSSVIR
jgi:hypothetical protein